jgi:uncharacterized protein
MAAVAKGMWDFIAGVVREFAQRPGNSAGRSRKNIRPNVRRFIWFGEEQRNRRHRRGTQSIEMKKRTSALKFCLTFVLLCAVGFARGEDVNKIQPTGYVLDLAGVIKPETKVQLEAMCLELEQKTGAQLAIVTVKSLDGNEAAPYANSLYKHLGVGSKKDDRGVLLLVAPNDRKYWTEVGYGLEPVINDARAGDAGRAMVPYLRQGDYNNGIAAAAWRLAKYIADDKGVTLTGQPQIKQVRQNNDSSGGLWVWLILAVILFMILASRGGSSSGRGGGMGSGWWVGPVIGATMGRRGGGWGGSSGGFGGGGGWGGGGGGFGGFGGGSSGGGGAGGSW